MGSLYGFVGWGPIEGLFGELTEITQLGNKQRVFCNLHLSCMSVSVLRRPHNLFNNLTCSSSNVGVFSIDGVWNVAPLRILRSFSKCLVGASMHARSPTKPHCMFRTISTSYDAYFTVSSIPPPTAPLDSNSLPQRIPQVVTSMSLLQAWESPTTTCSLLMARSRHCTSSHTQLISFCKRPLPRPFSTWKSLSLTSCIFPSI